MIDQPLDSDESSKLIMFFIVLLPGIVIGIFIIPIVFVLFKSYMLQKERDFRHIDSAKLIFSYYIKFVISIMAITLVYAIVSHYEAKYLISIFAVGIMSMFYQYVFTNWFYLPLSEHKNWITENGLMASFKN